MTVKKKPMNKSVIPVGRIEQAIYLIRRQKVMLDTDLAQLYGVETFNLNKAVKRNLERFPEDFMFQLTKDEWETLKFQSGMPKQEGRGGSGTNWVSDIGLVKITEKGPWDHAKLGDSSTIGPDGAVLCAGFPAPHIDPLPPVTTALVPLQQTPYVGWNHELVLALSARLMGGSSGGGVFDRDGRLVAIYTGPGHGRRIETFRAQEEYLKRERPMVVHSLGD